MSDEARTEGTQSAEVKPEATTAAATASTTEQPTVDLSVLGDDFKETKVRKDVFSKIIPFLKDRPDDFADFDHDDYSLYRKGRVGWEKAHNTRNTELGRKAQEADAKRQEYEEKLAQIEEEKASVEKMMGDAFYYSDPEVKKAMDKARAKLAEGAWTQEDADDFVRPFLSGAKSKYEARQKEEAARIRQLEDDIARVSSEMLAEVPPDFADGIVSFGVRNGRKPDEVATAYKEWMKSHDEAVAAQAVLEYKRSLKEQPPKTETQNQSTINQESRTPSMAALKEQLIRQLF